MSRLKKMSTILLLASIFMLVSAAGEIIELFYYSSTYGYNYYEIVDFIGPVAGIVAALLFIIGFMTLRDS
jgi:CYTH domain-containing protein